LPLINWHWTSSREGYEPPRCEGRQEKIAPCWVNSRAQGFAQSWGKFLDIDSIGGDIVHCAIKVHTALGPGLLESAYQKCLAYELRQLGHEVECELQLPIQYGPVSIDAGYRLDMLVAKSVIVENKTVDALQPIHEAQLLTYLKIKGLQLGFLLNWNVTLMKQGIKRVVHNFEASR
jgi:GxxExxY protein